MHAADAQGVVDREGGRRDDGDFHDRTVAELHDRAFAELPLDLGDGEIHRLRAFLRFHRH